MSLDRDFYNVKRETILTAAVVITAAAVITAAVTKTGLYKITLTSATVSINK